MTESGFPSSGIPLKDLAICSDCDLAFFASDGVCPKCASSIGWMLLPTKFTKQPEKKDDQKD